MNRSRAILGLGLAAVLPLVLLGCPKKDVPTVDAAPAPTPTPTPTQTETNLTPLDEDAGSDASDASDAKPKWTGPAVNPNQLRIRQCCNAIRTQAKSLGTSPEAAQMVQAAAMCDGVSMAVTSTGAGQAPEFAPVRQMLAGKSIPPICQGL
ncbi:MAG TPA: hypothetical protein VF316_02340 [Polyangiaceae bacterium]